MTGPLSTEEINAALRGGMQITPSDPASWADTWRGIRADGCRWTTLQLHRMRLELDQAKKSDTALARAVVAKLREPEKVEAWPIELSDGSTVDCPLLARSRDGRRILIVTPGGDKLWRDAR